jgi:hypothetical protein
VFTQDATLVSLCLSAYPWARYRRRKGALKLHMLFDHEGMGCTYRVSAVVVYQTSDPLWIFYAGIASDHL